MRRSVGMYFLVLALSFVFASAVMAREAMMPQRGVMPGEIVTTPEHWGKLEKFTGAVENVDMAKHEVVVQSQKGKMTFLVDPETIISNWTQHLPFSKVEKGMWTTVEYVMKANKPIARWINVAKTEAQLEKNEAGKM